MSWLVCSLMASVVVNLGVLGLMGTPPAPCSLDRDVAIEVTDGLDRWLTCDWRGL